MFAAFYERYDRMLTAGPAEMDRECYASTLLAEILNRAESLRT